MQVVQGRKTYNDKVLNRICFSYNHLLVYRLLFMDDNVRSYCAKKSWHKLPFTHIRCLSWHPWYTSNNISTIPIHE